MIRLYCILAYLAIKYTIQVFIRKQKRLIASFIEHICRREYSRHVNRAESLTAITTLMTTSACWLEHRIRGHAQSLPVLHLHLLSHNAASELRVDIIVIHSCTIIAPLDPLKDYLLILRALCTRHWRCNLPFLEGKAEIAELSALLKCQVKRCTPFLT